VIGYSPTAEVKRGRKKVLQNGPQHFDGNLFPLKFPYNATLWLSSLDYQKKNCKVGAQDFY